MKIPWQITTRIFPDPDTPPHKFILAVPPDVIERLRQDVAAVISKLPPGAQKNIIDIVQDDKIPPGMAELISGGNSIRVDV